MIIINELERSVWLRITSRIATEIHRSFQERCGDHKKMDSGEVDEIIELLRIQLNCDNGLYGFDEYYSLIHPEED